MNLTSLSKSVVFSYHKNHQEFVLKISDYLKRENIPVWIDIEDGIDQDIYQSVNEIGILVCFMTPMYQASKNYQEQVELVKSAGIPVIGICFLPNWKPSGWLSKMKSDLSMIDFRGINQTNFQDKINKLQKKIIWLLEKNDQKMNNESSIDENLIDRSIFFDDSNLSLLVENVNLNYSKKKKQPLNYRIIPSKCRVNLSNLMICNNEYILIHGNNHFHLFDKNLKLIRSNNEMKIDQNSLKDLIWCLELNYFIILTLKHVYLMNPLTTKISIIENIKLKDQREEFISCSCSEEKFYLITCQSNSNSFYFEEYSLPSFRFIRKYSIIDLIGIYLFVQNGSFNKNHIQQINSIRYYQKKIAMIIQISFQWFIYIFHLYEQPILSTKILLEEKSRMTILYPINQWIIFKDDLSNSFIQTSMDFQKKIEYNRFKDYSRGFIDFDRKLRSIALFGVSNLVLLLDDALLIYKL